MIFAGILAIVFYVLIRTLYWGYLSNAVVGMGSYSIDPDYLKRFRLDNVPDSLQRMNAASAVWVSNQYENHVPTCVTKIVFGLQKYRFVVIIILFVAGTLSAHIVLPLIVAPNSG